jgi:hypothetical protein
MKLRLFLKRQPTLIDFIAKFVAALSDTELAYVKQAVYDETYKRLTVQLDTNDYPTLNREEVDLLSKGEKMTATRLYRDRTGVKLRLAYEIMKKGG